MASNVGATPGWISENIRKLLGRVDGVEGRSDKHEKEILELRALVKKAQTDCEKTQADLARTEKVADHQGKEVEAHRRALEDQKSAFAALENTVEALEEQSSEQSRTMEDLGRQLRGEQIKRGKANAARNRAEDKLGRLRK